MMVLSAALFGCSGENSGWKTEERDLVMNGKGAMKVVLVTDRKGKALLERKSSDIPVEALRGDVFSRLAGRMLDTVMKEGGVGIAGPQVGVSRRLVVVQRFDKERNPFEVYPNIRIVAVRGGKEAGPEGCLSVPDRREDVLRWRDIDISYTSLKTLSDTTETVTGFTAVIFQHECDHLDGILFTDRL